MAEGETNHSRRRSGSSQLTAQPKSPGSTGTTISLAYVQKEHCGQFGPGSGIGKILTNIARQSLLEAMRGSRQHPGDSKHCRCQ